MQSCGIFRGAAPAARAWQSCGVVVAEELQGDPALPPGGLCQLLKGAGRAGRAEKAHRAGAAAVRAAAHIQPFQGTLGNMKNRESEITACFCGKSV